MATPTPPVRPAVLDAAGLQALLDALVDDGYRVLGPVERDGAIVDDEVRTVADLPVGRTEEQDAGRYRLVDRADGAWFGYALGPRSPKRFVFPARSVVARAHRTDAGFEVEEVPVASERLALVGVRACELHALGVLDRVLGAGPAADPTYAETRAQTFVVAVQCGDPGGTCFCTSTGTGPAVTDGADLVLTELCDTHRHELLAVAGSARGGDLLARLPRRPAEAADHAAAAEVVARAVAGIRRRLRPDAREVLADHLEHPRWDDVAARCLGCGNCTLVCPTCFCSAIDDVTDLAGTTAERVRRWDSCFTLDHSHLPGGSVRTSVRDRYRQWLTHKLSTWWDQFDTSGCVGCGRCITWCPAGIDLTAEVRAIASDREEAPT